MSIWAKNITVLISCAILCDRCILWFNKSNCGTGRVKRDQLSWPTLSSVCSNAVLGSQTWSCLICKQRLQCICSTLLKCSSPKKLYYEFWINLSFGRHWHSGGLWEQQIWFDVWCVFCGWWCFEFLLFVMWMNEYFLPCISIASHFLSLFSSSCLKSGLCMTNTLLLWSMLGPFPSFLYWLILLQGETKWSTNGWVLFCFSNRTAKGSRAPYDHPRWEESPDGGSQSQRTKYSRRKVR